MRPLLRLSCALLALSLASGTAQATCGAEGCPFVRDGLGDAMHRFALGLRFQSVTQDQLWSGGSAAERDDLIREIYASGESHSELELYTQTRTWVLDGRAQLSDRLLVTATLPYMQREHTHMLVHAPFYNPAFEDTWKYEGLGDAVLLGHFRALAGQGRPVLTLQGGVKLPTGRTHVPDEVRENFGFESALEPAARPGTGSTDWLAGAQLDLPLPWRRVLPLTGSVLSRWNTKGTDDYQVGDELQLAALTGYRVAAPLALSVQANYSSHGSDVSTEASEPAHSGMRALYVTPGFSLQVSHGASLYGLFQMRVWGETDDANVVGTNHLVLGTTIDVGR